MRPKEASKVPAESNAPVTAGEANEPTRPRPRDAAGHELDQWGLPLAGPLRVAALAAAGRPDPNVEPQAWAEPAEAAMTEKSNG